MTFLDFVTHLFLPNESNNHKPKLLQPYTYLFYIVFFLVFGIGTRFVHRVAPNILGIATNISVSDLLTLTNQKRIEAGLTPLSLNNELNQAATQKAMDMFKDNYWAHFSPKGKSPWDFIINAGYKYIYAGENLARDFSDSEGVVNAWMASSSHRDNILKPEYKDIGFAVVNGILNGSETTLVVQMFGTSATVVQATEPAKPVVSVPLTPTSFPPVFIAGVKKEPLFDINKLNKILTLSLLLLLILILILDSFFIWKKKIIRISGHNFAHIIFICALIAIIFITGKGSVL